MGFEVTQPKVILHLGEPRWQRARGKDVICNRLQDAVEGGGVDFLIGLAASFSLGERQRQTDRTRTRASVWLVKRYTWLIKHVLSIGAREKVCYL